MTPRKLKRTQKFDKHEIHNIVARKMAIIFIFRRFNLTLIQKRKFHRFLKLVLADKMSILDQKRRWSLKKLNFLLSFCTNDVTAS